MLLWLIDAAGVEPSLVSAARRSAVKAKALASSLLLYGSMYLELRMENVLWKRSTEVGSAANPGLAADA